MGIITMDSSTRLRNFFLSRLSRSRIVILTIFGLFLAVYVLSPYDSALRSALRWQTTIASDFVQHKYPDDKWLFKDQKYPIDPTQDVAIILKTGFGTRDRVPNVLAALGNETFDNNILLVQDYPVNRRKPYVTASGNNVPTIDVIGWMLEKKLSTHIKSERLTKYNLLFDAIEAEDYFMADTLAKGNGWELDAMKVWNAP